MQNNPPIGVLPPHRRIWRAPTGLRLHSCFELDRDDLVGREIDGEGASIVRNRDLLDRFAVESSLLRADHLCLHPYRRLTRPASDLVVSQAQCTFPGAAQRAEHQPIGIQSEGGSPAVQDVRGGEPGPPRRAENGSPPTPRRHRMRSNRLHRPSAHIRRSRCRAPVRPVWECRDRHGRFSIRGRRVTVGRRNGRGLGGDRLKRSVRAS